MRDLATTTKRNLGNTKDKHGLRDSHRNKVSAPPILDLSSVLSYFSALLPFLSRHFSANIGS